MYFEGNRTFRSQLCVESGGEAAAVTQAVWTTVEVKTEASICLFWQMFVRRMIRKPSRDVLFFKVTTNKLSKGMMI